MRGAQQSVDTADTDVAPPKPTVGSLLDDLRDERVEVRGLVDGLADEDWGRPTTPGWTVRDQIAHLAYYDEVATTSITDPERFAGLRQRALGDIPTFEREHLLAVPSAGAATVQAWDQAAEGFRSAAAAADSTVRVPWFGPDMGLMSMISARLMETWAHGQDVADGLGVEREPTDRLRHVAGLAVRARAQGYVIRELAVPDQPIRVELTAPITGRWAFGPQDATDRVRGPAADFCLVLTRRRHVDDTALECEGAAAREWMEIGQAYAGPAGAGPGRRHDSRDGVRR